MEMTNNSDLQKGESTQRISQLMITFPQIIYRLLRRGGNYIVVPVASAKKMMKVCIIADLFQPPLLPVTVPMNHETTVH